MAIPFSRVQDYLNAIADAATLDASNAGHDRFWNGKYADFIGGTVPTKICNGQQVPIIDPVSKVQSAFFQILKAQWCGMPQMPKKGPYATATGQTFTVTDSKTGAQTNVTGDKILADIEDWLKNGALENG